MTSSVYHDEYDCVRGLYSMKENFFCNINAMNNHIINGHSSPTYDYSKIHISPMYEWLVTDRSKFVQQVNNLHEALFCYNDTSRSVNVWIAMFMMNTRAE